MSSKRDVVRNPIPVMTLTDAFKTMQAYSRGESELPSWAGKKVRMGQPDKKVRMGQPDKKVRIGLSDKMVRMGPPDKGPQAAVAVAVAVEEASPSKGIGSFAKLYSDNKELIVKIANEHPESVAALAKLVKRGESNVSRTLAKLAGFGIVSLVPAKSGRAKMPVLLMESVHLKLELKTGEVVLVGA